MCTNMKGYILNSTYKEITIINENDDYMLFPSHSFPNNPINNHNSHLNQISSNYIAHDSKNTKFNPYNLIDYL